MIIECLDSAEEHGHVLELMRSNYRPERLFVTVDGVCVGFADDEQVGWELFEVATRVVKVAAGEEIPDVDWLELPEGVDGII